MRRLDHGQPETLLAGRECLLGTDLVLDVARHRDDIPRGAIGGFDAPPDDLDPPVRPVLAPDSSAEPERPTGQRVFLSRCHDIKVIRVEEVRGWDADYLRRVPAEDSCHRR
jgi:hypothetical protein